MFQRASSGHRHIARWYQVAISHIAPSASRVPRSRTTARSAVHAIRQTQRPPPDKTGPWLYNFCAHFWRAGGPARLTCAHYKAKGVGRPRGARARGPGAISAMPCETCASYLLEDGRRVGVALDGWKARELLELLHVLDEDFPLSGGAELEAMLLRPLTQKRVERLVLVPGHDGEEVEGDSSCHCMPPHRMSETQLLQRASRV